MLKSLALSPRSSVALAFALAASLAALPAAAGTCYGTYYEYYDGPAFNQIVGAKVSCPGFPDQVDEDPNGNAVETPWFITETVVCPCSGGSGGGGGEGDPHDSNEESP